MRVNASYEHYQEYPNGAYRASFGGSPAGVRASIDDVPDDTSILKSYVLS